MNAVIPISALVLTKDEEMNLPGCLKSVSFSDDIHVFDSFSADGTVSIAGAVGATVTQRRFDDYASQRNAALQGITFKYPWVLIVDADERVPEALTREIKSFLQRPDVEAFAACRMKRKDFFMGRWLKHASISQYFIRLVRPEKVHYERTINEVLKVDGAIYDLQEPFDHYPFSNGITHWIDKHNRYSTMEAEVIVQERAGKKKPSPGKAVFSRDFNERRYYQKQLFYHMPLRPLIKWLYMIFVRGAFLDGTPGITYAFLQSIYEYFIVLKTKELENKTQP